MKYILKKDLPLAKAGTEVTIRNIDNESKFLFIEDHRDHLKISHLAMISKKDIPEWIELEEVKEVKTIYDLKEWDDYYEIYNDKIRKFKLSNWDGFTEQWHTLYFLTEREAKRNKLLRELATRDKWLPKDGETYIDQHNDCNKWDNDECEIMWYNMWLLFRDKEEYNKWMTEEAKYLLFKI